MPRYASRFGSVGKRTHGRMVPCTLLVRCVIALCVCLMIPALLTHWLTAPPAPPQHKAPETSTDPVTTKMPASLPVIIADDVASETPVSQTATVIESADAPSPRMDDGGPTAHEHHAIPKQTAPTTPRPRRRTLFELRTTPLEPPIHYHDVFDPMPPRDGESFITFAEYMDCVAARLNVNRHTQQAYPFPEAERTHQWPYVMVPVTAELRDVKALMCNISVPIRHLTYVQNFHVHAVSAFFDDLQRAFAFTDRLKVLRYRDNIGFAGAVNAGYRDALTYPFHEVPFYFLTNNDMRFGPGLLETMMPRYYAAVADDEAAIKALEAEVASEPNPFTPARARQPLLRANGTTTYLVTSRLLPDRVRYASRIAQLRAFRGHYGGLFLERGAGTSTWGQTRLSMETVGFWDENFYPAYIEDVDYRYRQRALGFKDCLPPFGLGGFLHYRSVTFKTGNAETAAHVMRPVADGGGSVAGLSAAELAAVLNAQRGFYRGLVHVLNAHVNVGYGDLKWGSWRKESARGPYLFPVSEGSTGTMARALPVDCWVWHVARREAIATATLLSVQHYMKHPNASLDQPFLGFLPEPLAGRFHAAMQVTRGLVNPATKSPFTSDKALDPSLQPTVGASASDTLLGNYTLEDEAHLPEMPRPGERNPTMAEFLACLEHVLDPAFAASSPDHLLPLMVVPMVLEVRDHRAMVCSLDIPVRRVLYVHNGGVREVHRFLNTVERALAHTGRVTVHHHPADVGFSGAVNHGIAEVLRGSQEEMPFFLMVNNDVRFPAGLLAARLMRLRNVTQGDRAVVDQLTREVAEEGAAVASMETTAADRRAYVRAPWTPYTNGVVTSPLLPARVRQLPLAEQQQMFTNHTGVMFFHRSQDGSAFLLTRLAVAVTGYWDDNFYPAYFEDADYWFRLTTLGFQMDQLPKIQPGEEDAALPEAVHYVNALRKLQQQAADTDTPQHTTLSPSAAVAIRRIEVLFRNPPSYYYSYAKWGTYRGAATPREPRNSMFYRYPVPFGEDYRVPVDVWVGDEVRINATRRYLLAGCHTRRDPTLWYSPGRVAPFALEHPQDYGWLLQAVLFAVLTAAMFVV